jgi:hypothetical protein
MSLLEAVAPAGRQPVAMSHKSAPNSQESWQAWAQGDQWLRLIGGDHQANEP